MDNEQNKLQEFDLMALAEFGCRMCRNARQAHRIEHGQKPVSCIWKNEKYGALGYFGCDSLKLALTDFLEETR